MKAKKIVSNLAGIGAGALIAYGGMKWTERVSEKMGLFEDGTPLECAAVGAYQGVPGGLAAVLGGYSVKVCTEMAWDAAAKLLEKLG